MPTPGSIKRYLNSAWTREASVILNVPNAAALPVAPDEDDVFAFVNNTKTMYYSQSGAWVAYNPIAALDVYAWGVIGPNQALTANTWTIVPVPTPLSISKSDGLTDDFVRNADGTVTVVRAGHYVIEAVIVTGAVGVTVYAEARLSTTTGAVPGFSDYIAIQSQTPAGGQAFGLSMAAGRYLTAGSRVAVLLHCATSVTASVVNISIARTGGPKGEKGDPGSLGTAVLNDLNDTTIATPLDRQALIYEASSGQWKNSNAMPRGLIAWNPNTSIGSGAAIGTTPVVIGSCPAANLINGRYYRFTTQIRAILAGGDTVFTVSCRVGASEQDIRQEQLQPVRAAPQFWGGGTYEFLYLASSAQTGVKFYGAVSIGGVNFYNDNANSWVEDLGTG